MDRNRVEKYWLLVTALLIVIIIASSAIAWARYAVKQPIEISLSPRPELQGEIYILGAVPSPGLFPLKSADSISDLIKAAGGATAAADLTQIKLYIPAINEGHQSQKIDINRAEAWLLQALPEIGSTKAQAIINYRNQNGPFRNTYELTEVEGIGNSTYEKIKHLLTVSD